MQRKNKAKDEGLEKSLMNCILAFDTSSTACSIALQKKNQIESSHVIAPRQQAQLILPAIDSLLQKMAMTLGELDAVAYGCGPGSLTGIRLASTLAQGLGIGLGIPLYAISSLAILAQTAYQTHGWHNIIVCVDAHQEQLYWAHYQLDTNREHHHHCVKLVAQESLISLNGQITAPAEPYIAIGSGWTKLKYINATLQNLPDHVETELYPHASAILALTQALVKKEPGLLPKEALPIYLR